jgi:mono/diheme cytochrome c family protein
MTPRRSSVAFAAVLGAAVAFSFSIRIAAAGDASPKVARVFGTEPRDDAVAAAAFESMLPVLHHPRCMNCHSSGDFPRQGDDGHRHTMNVRRGPNGHGILAVQCSSCHQDHNLAGEHMPPGAPGWHLPAPAMPMIWEGLTDRQLCELLKDPRQNGDRNVDEIVEHFQTPLVLWGWHPGDGRTPVPVTQSEFLAKVKKWAAKGAACPVR